MNTDKKCCECWQRNYEVDIIQHKKTPLLVCTDLSLNALHLLNIIEIYCQNIIPFFFFCWQLNTLRGSILEDAVPSTSKHGLARGLPLKEVLEYLVPELNAHCLRLALNTPKVTEQLMKLDEQGVRRGSTCRLEWSSVSFWWRNWKIERKKKKSLWSRSLLEGQLSCILPQTLTLLCCSLSFFQFLSYFLWVK